MRAAIAAALLLAAGAARADVGLNGWGLRGGVSDDPDQFLFGAHWDLGTFAPNWRFQPHADLGFGDDVFSLSGNAMAGYYFPVKGSVTPYAGGQVTAAFFDYDNSALGSDVEFGAGIVGGMEAKMKTGRFLAEIQIGLGDVADFKLMAGWTF
jgi:hypothetical protein